MHIAASKYGSKGAGRANNSRHGATFFHSRSTNLLPFFLGLPRSLPVSQSRNAARSLQKVLSTRLDTRAVFFFLSFFSFSTSRELCGQTHTVHTPNADQTSSTAAVQQIRLPRASMPPTTQKRLSLRCENPHRERKQQQQQQQKEKSSLSASATSSRHSLCTTLSPKSHFCTLPILSRDLPQLGGGKNRKQTSPRRNNPQRRDTGCGAPARR